MHAGYPQGLGITLLRTWTTLAQVCTTWGGNCGNLAYLATGTPLTCTNSFHTLWITRNFPTSSRPSRHLESRCCFVDFGPTTGAESLPPHSHAQVVRKNHGQCPTGSAMGGSPE